MTVFIPRVPGTVPGGLGDPAYAMRYKKDTEPTSYENETHSIGFIGNANYLYDNRYFADLSMSYDGSSQFGSDNKFAPFWSVGAGWNLHREKFFPKAWKVNTLKLRYSYGITGNQEFKAYQAKTTLQFMTDRRYNTGMAALLMGYGNPHLKWQKKYDSNLGLDLVLAQRRLSLTFNYYNTKTDGMLADITVAPSVGLPSNTFTANLGKIRNQGYEANILGAIIRKPANQLEWSVSLQLAHNKNKLLEISEYLRNINNETNENKFTPGYIYEEGRSMNSIFAVRSLGIDPYTGKEIFIKKDGSLTYEWNAEDKVYCGKEDPKLFGNIGTNLYWRGWNLNAVFQFRLGSDIYNQTLAKRVEGADPNMNADRRVLNHRWKTPGDHARYRDIKEYTSNYISSRFIQRENMIQMTNISLSYEFDRDKISKYKLRTFRLSFYMNNPFRLSTIKEERGLDYPFERSYVFGLNVSF